MRWMIIAAVGRRVALALLVLSVVASACSGRTERIDSETSIASLEKVRLGGVDQWILIRGVDASAPVLLFVHGGPGSPELPLNHEYGLGLEENFVLVHWDQRGAGKSHSLAVSPKSMNVDQFIADCHELTLLLKERFGRDRVYIMGHSWGSLLGTLTVARHPEDYYAYIGIGQVVDLERNEAISYQFVVDEAKARERAWAQLQLKLIGPPPYSNDLKLAIQRQWLQEFGGAVYRQDGYAELAAVMVNSPEYTALDLFKFSNGVIYSIVLMWDEVMTYDLIEQVPRLEVPVYFLHGRHDYNTPWELAEEYYEALDAPAGKTLIWFEQSAHSPNMEEPERFARVMVERVLAETYSP